MTEAQLISAFTSNGWQILNTTTHAIEGGIQHKSVYASKAGTDTIQVEHFHYFIKTDGSAYWLNYNPAPASTLTFMDKVTAKLQALITAGTIKAGYVERQNELNKTAVVVVINTTNEFKTFHIYEDGSGVIQYSQLTGTYPV